MQMPDVNAAIAAALVCCCCRSVTATSVFAVATVAVARFFLVLLAPPAIPNVTNRKACRHKNFHFH